MATTRPGPKPRRLYLRLAMPMDRGSRERPPAAEMRRFLQNLDRVGRFVAHGPLSDPPGDALLLRSVGLDQATRTLRPDPWRTLAEVSYRVIEWDPAELGTGITLEPAPARGSGRLTALHRVGVAVTDAPRAREWYERVLGLSARAADRETGYFELALGRGAPALFLIAPRPEWGEPHFTESRSRIGRPTGIVFQTDSVPALALRLAHAGARLTAGPTLEPWGARTLRFLDPDGNEFLAFEPVSLPAARHNIPRGATRPATLP